MHNFRRLGVLTQIAHVITKANYKELPDTMRYLRSEFPAEGGHLSICLAIAQGISDLVFQWVIPTFSEIKPFVSEALDFCLETGVGFGGMIGQGGYPPCMLDGDLRYYDDNLDKVFKSDDAASSSTSRRSAASAASTRTAWARGARTSSTTATRRSRRFAPRSPPVRAARGGVRAAVDSAETALAALAASVPARPPADVP